MAAQYGTLHLTKNSVIRVTDKPVSRALIPLDRIDGILTNHQSSPIWLVLAGVSGLGGTYMQMEGGDGMIVGVGGALIFAVVYFVTRRAKLIIRAGDVMIATAARGKHTDAVQFMDQVVEARERYAQSRIVGAPVGE